MKWFVLAFVIVVLATGCSGPSQTQIPPPASSSTESPPPTPILDGDEVASANSEGNRGVKRVDKPEESPAHHCHRQRFAVCIGINKYEKDSGFSTLHYAGNDAVQIAEALAGTCGFEHILLLTDSESPAAIQNRFKPYSKTTLVVSDDVTFPMIDESVKEFLSHATSEDDLIVFFFAGHADSPKSNVAYLVPSDFHPTKRVHHHIPLNSLVQDLDRHPIMAQNRLVLLDTCRSEHAMASTFSNVLDQQNVQSVIFASCEKNQSSFEQNDLSHGRFSWALIGAIQQQAGTDWLWVGDLTKYVTDQFSTKKWSNRRPRASGQDPRIIPRGSYSDNRYFALRCPGPGTAVEMPMESVEGALNEAREAYLANRLEGALQNYSLCFPTANAAAKTDRKNWAGDVMAEYSRVLYRLGFIDNANEMMSRAADLVPQNPVLAEIRGFQDLDAGRYKQATQQFKIARTNRKPKDITAFMIACHGLANYQLGDFDAATLDFATAVKTTKQATYALAYKRFEINSLKNSGKHEETIIALKQYEGQLVQLGADPSKDLRIAAVHESLGDSLKLLTRDDEATKERNTAHEIRATGTDKGQLWIYAGRDNDLFPDSSEERRIIVNRDDHSILNQLNKGT